MNPTETPLERVLWSADTPCTSPTWVGLHDRVMGGRSEGSAQPQSREGVEPAHVLFSGHIRRDNGGGFASFRLRLPAPVVLDVARAVVLTWRGDGGAFKLCLHRQNDWDGVQWQVDLPTASHWTTQALPLSAFVARRRGRELRERPLCAGDALFQMGLLTASASPGPFGLALARIALR